MPYDARIPQAAPDPRLRVSDDHREQVVEHVKTAYAQGRFDKDEFDDRVDRAMTARTHADLMPIMEELYGPRRAPVMPYHDPRAYPRRALYSRDGVAPRGPQDTLGAGAAHLLPLAGLSFVGPLIILLAAGKTSPYIRAHAVEALNFQLSLLGLSVLLAITLVGIILIPFLWIGAFVLSIIGGVKGMAGEHFRYPLTLRMVT